LKGSIDGILIFLNFSLHYFEIKRESEEKSESEEGERKRILKLMNLYI